MAAEDVCRYELTVGQVVGDSFSALVGTLSSLAVVIYTARMIDIYYRIPAEIRTLKRGVVVLVGSLLASDLLQGIGAAMDAKWANERSSRCGEYCTAQGALRLIGQTGDALSILGIAVATFISIWFPASHVRAFRSNGFKPAVIYVGIVWSYLLLWPIVAVGIHHNYDSPETLFFAPTPAWCWISESYKGARIAAEYAWLWLACAVTIVLYIWLGLLFCEIITPSSTWPHLPQRVYNNEDVKDYGDRRTAAMLISYPIGMDSPISKLKIQEC
ncbi:G protein coupled glucose receptor regulating Gpa2 protein [Ceratobasidium sp. AG-Ba]|nr:G protein coupled glucose receptor regulating Gpa2 protein [Ceratobasidium sp. AG-Ba]